MNHPFLSANEALAQSDGNSHRYNLFTALLGPNTDAVPLDNAGLFSLIRTARYQELLATLQEAQQIKQQMETQCHSLSLTNTSLAKERDLCQAQLRQFKQN